MKFTTTIIPLILIVTLCGCMVEGRDATTGERIWGPLSGADAATRPTTNPATGNAVVVVPAKEVDYDKVADAAREGADYLPSPYRELVIAGLTLGGVWIGQRRRKVVPAAPSTVDVNVRQL
jgi:hypothetical protein